MNYATRALRKGTVCYLINLDEFAAQLTGFVVTLTGETSVDDGRTYHHFTTPLYLPLPTGSLYAVIGATRDSLLPINDPDHDVSQRHNHEVTA